MMKKVIYAFLSCFVLLLTGGCREQDCVEEIDTSHARNSLYLNLSLRVNDGSGAVSRATGDEILGTSDENAIHSLYIYLFNSSTNDLVYWADITNLYQSDDTKTYVIKLQDISLPEGVSIYLAANLTLEQAESIKRPEATYKTNATSYTRAINEFAPYEFMPQFGVTGISKRDIGIAMTGQAVSAEDSEQKSFGNIYQYNSLDNPLSLKVDLKRVVAKALLTVAAATTDNIAEGADKNEDYALIDSGNKNKGWVRISDIYYFPNGTNKSLYWFKQTDNNEDPNSDLTYYITSTEADTELALNTAKYQNDFVYYNQTDQYKLYYAYYQAKKFDESQNEANTYTDGMYFLENTFSTSDLTDGHRNQLQTYKLALPMVTSISIALRYTPKKIYVEKGLYDKLESGTGMSASERQEWENMKDKYAGNKPWDDTSWTADVGAVIFQDEADAQFVLTMSLKLNKAYISSTEYGNQVTNGTYSGSKFPDNTFFAFTPETDTDDKFLYHYYTYGARQKIVNPIYYVPYVGGWAYYYTYLDGDSTDFGEGTNSSKAEYSDSQVKRNTYYILKLNKITRLGGSKTDPNNIQVNTTVVPWTKGGRLEVDLW